MLADFYRYRIIDTDQFRECFYTKYGMLITLSPSRPLHVICKSILPANRFVLYCIQNWSAIFILPLCALILETFSMQLHVLYSVHDCSWPIHLAGSVCIMDAKVASSRENFLEY